MIDWEKRKEELFREYKIPYRFINEIIEQEKKMINEIKNENLLNHYIDTFSFYEER